MKHTLFSIGLILILGFSGASSLNAQEFHLTPWEWIDQDDPPDIFPKFKYFKTPPVPKEIKALDSYAYAIIEGGVLKSGRWWNLHFETTHPTLKRNLFQNRSKKPKPAYRGKKKVTSAIWRALIFNPKQSDPDLANAQPRLLQVAPVILPRHETKPTSELIFARLTVDKNGQVINAELSPEISADTFKASKRALKKWKFSPARANGDPVEATIEVPLIIRRGFDLVSNSDVNSPPTLLKHDPPVYPLSQRMAGVEGEVTVQFIVTIEGNVRHAFAAKSNNPAFDEPAIEAVLKWKYKPAEKNGRPVNARVMLPMVFKLSGGGSNGFSIQGSKKNQKKLPPKYRYDVAPKLVNISPIVYPYNSLVAKEKGEVQFMFVVDTKGYAHVVKVVNSSGEDFTAAVTAMFDTVRFEPALEKGHPTKALLAMKLKFADWNADIIPSKSANRLLRVIRKGKKTREIVSARELDHNLISISQEPPVFPRALSSEIKEGSALIEFYVDHYGMAQLPRIIKSSHKPFGYAACQAISAWRFKPPRRDSRSVAVKVRAPVVFKRE